MEAKLKHLEFIQNVITRMNSNSFMIKGWTIAIVSALFALAANNSNQKLIWAVFIIVPVFWILDGFFLSMERQYRGLYNDVIIKDTTDFEMKTTQYNNVDRTWVCSIFSSTLFVFYGLLFFLTFIVGLLIGIIPIRLCCCY
jgi:hypothetical protein